jgi:ABC-type polysaccharide/polyol phosphate export permease
MESGTAMPTPGGLANELIESPVESTETLERDPTAVEVVDHRPSVLETVADAWRSRHLLWQIASTALMAYFVRYRLGPTWLILQTFMSLVGFTLIFGGGVFNVKAPNGMPYFIFMVVGMMGWQLFQSTLMISARSFMRLKPIVRDLHFPLILVPIAGSAQALVRFLLNFLAYVIAVIVFWITRGHIYAQLQPKYLFFSVLGLFLCALLAWGMSMWTAPLTMHTRDVRFAIKYVLPFWVFVTPVMYPIDHLHGKTRLVAELNPLSSPIEMAKVGMLGAGSVRLYATIWSVGLIVLVFASGVWFMNRFGSRLIGVTSDVAEDDDTDMFM